MACSTSQSGQVALDDAGGSGSGAGGSGSSAPSTALPDRLDLGAGDCGGTASATFELANHGRATLTYLFASPDSSIAVAPATGVVTAGASTTVRVIAQVPARSHAGRSFTTTLAATTNAPDLASRSIPVTFRARGAELALDRPVIGFGETAIGVLATQPLSVRNTGDRAATVAFAAPGGEFGQPFGTTGAMTIAPGASMAGEVSYLPRKLGRDDATSGVVVSGVTCGEPLSALTLTGQGVAGDAVMVQGGPIDFGDVACGVPATAVNVRLVNPTAIDAGFTTRLLGDGDGDQHRFSVSPQQGSVPANGAIDLVVETEPLLAPTPSRQYDAILRIVTTLGVATVHDLPLRQTLRAPMLAINRTVNFGIVPLDKPLTLPLKILNVGNATASLRLVQASPPAFKVTLPSSVESGEIGFGEISYTPTSTEPITASIAVSASGACEAPHVISLQAGHGPIAALEPATVTASCPPPDTLSVNLSIRNDGDQTLHISCFEDGDSGLALQVPLSFPDGFFRVAPHDALTLPITLSPGPIVAGSIDALVACLTNEPSGEVRVTTITRTLREDDTPCVDPGAATAP